MISCPFVHVKRKYTVGITDEASNGDREMASAHITGFKVIDINTVDIMNNKHILEKLNGLAFVGGFSTQMSYPLVKDGIMFHTTTKRSVMP